MELKTQYPALILLVDDHPENLQVLGTVLGEHYQIAVAENGRDAMEFVRHQLPDLILLDVMLPDISGFEVCKRLKTFPEIRDIPIIFLTAKTETKHIITGFRAGGVDYITKPFNTMELLVRVHTHIDLWGKTRLLQSLADRDGLTMIPNRRRFDEVFALEWRRCLREQQPLSLLMIDIDWFKRYNDLYGHLKGDECLKQIANVISRAVRRPGDLAARYGGEEFAVILGNTREDPAMMIAEKLRTAIEQQQIVHENAEGRHIITVSLGGATMIPRKQSRPEDLIHTADQRLYEAKKAGRNQVNFGK